MEVAFTSIWERRLEAKEVVHVAIAELRSTQNEYDALQWQLDMWRSMLEEKNKRVVLGEVLLVDTKIDWFKVEDVITHVKQDVLVLKDEKKAVHR